ncbi:MAG: DUF4914 family protein [Armatimonadetes bacterium]|nr:DUF4914 family protein [Armatimonadota bacterium]
MVGFDDVKFQLPVELAQLFEGRSGRFIAETPQDLFLRAASDAGGGWYEVAYDIPGTGRYVEARVCRVRNGLAANYTDPYMRRRDPDCMVIGDALPTDKPRFSDRYGLDFESLRNETLAWLADQELAAFFFMAGGPAQGLGAVAVAPANAAFFAYGLALLQGAVAPSDLPDDFRVGAVVYVAPPFRHTHFGGRQVVVHNRREGLHELFAYNLYPGPSAKKGVYGVLLSLGEAEHWVTAHCSAVQLVTPYGNKVTFMHEGASGGGKSEMLEHLHRESDGRVLLGRNLVTGEERHLTIPHTCRLRPIVDDMALCHPGIQKGNGKLTLRDAEQAWFVRVDHIRAYGTDPQLEKTTIQPKEPLLFLNIDAVPESTALIWEHIEDAPGIPCPNPRVVLPRRNVPDVLDGPRTVDVRSFGVRTPPCRRGELTYGILGLFHILPPALAWLWRLAAPRGHENPSIVHSEGMSSEGVGSYWPFAAGRRVDHANLLLDQIIAGTEMRYVLIPNQHIGAWRVGFMPQWLTREYLARRGAAWFGPEDVRPARCPLLGYVPNTVVLEGQTIPPHLLHVDQQPEVGELAYDHGSELLTQFFERELSQFLVDDLHPLGRQIIESCLAGADVETYSSLCDAPVLLDE